MHQLASAIRTNRQADRHMETDGLTDTCRLTVRQRVGLTIRHTVRQTVRHAVGQTDIHRQMYYILCNF